MLTTSPAQADLWSRLSVDAGALLGAVHGDNPSARSLMSPTIGLELALSARLTRTPIRPYLAFGGAYAPTPFIDGEALDGRLSWINLTAGAHAPVHRHWSIDIQFGIAKASARLARRADRTSGWGFLAGGGVLRQLGDGPLHLGGRLRWFRASDPDFDTVKTDHGLLTVVLAWIP